MKILNTRKNRVFGERVTIPMFEMIDCPTIRIADIRRRRFNIIDRHSNHISDDMVPATMEEILETGIVVHVWGAEFLTHDGEEE